RRRSPGRGATGGGSSGRPRSRRRRSSGTASMRKPSCPEGGIHAMNRPDPTDSALILVVERDPHVKKLERFFLEQAGYRVEFAEDGLQGLERARSSRPRIVVTEIMLPRLDGL